MGDSPTAAGTPKAVRGDVAGQSIADDGDMDCVDAINQLFSMMEVAYPGPFQRLFADAGKLSMAKQFWRRHLAAFHPETIVRAGDAVCASSVYLPSLHELLRLARQLSRGGSWPAPYPAYREACFAKAPQRLQAWSHIVVYHAGEGVGWHVLATWPEVRSWPLFERHYRELCEGLSRGQELPPVPPPSPTAGALTRLPVDHSRQRENLRALRARLD